MQDKASRSLKRISQNPQRARLFSSWSTVCSGGVPASTTTGFQAT
jgi:hypothetical protein